MSGIGVPGLGPQRESPIDAVAGNTYFIVIDGYNGEEGSYTIGVTCGG
jgi:hypothetical protein